MSFDDYQACGGFEVRAERARSKTRACLADLRNE